MGEDQGAGGESIDRAVGEVAKTLTTRVMPFLRKSAWAWLLTTVGLSGAVAVTVVTWVQDNQLLVVLVVCSVMAIVGALALYWQSRMDRGGQQQSPRSALPAGGLASAPVAQLMERANLAEARATTAEASVAKTTSELAAAQNRMLASENRVAQLERHAPPAVDQVAESAGAFLWLYARAPMLYLDQAQLKVQLEIRTRVRIPSGLVVTGWHATAKIGSYESQSLHFSNEIELVESGATYLRSRSDADIVIEGFRPPDIAARGTYPDVQFTVVCNLRHGDRVIARVLTLTSDHQVCRLIRAG